MSGGNGHGYAFAVLMLLAVPATAGASEPREVTFPSGNLQLHGFVFKLEGNGRFASGALTRGGPTSSRSSHPACAADFFVSRDGKLLFPPPHIELVSIPVALPDSEIPGDGQYPGLGG